QAVSFGFSFALAQLAVNSFITRSKCWPGVSSLVSGDAAQPAINSPPKLSTSSPRVQCMVVMSVCLLCGCRTQNGSISVSKYNQAARLKRGVFTKSSHKFCLQEQKKVSA